MKNNSLFVLGDTIPYRGADVLKKRNLIAFILFFLLLLVGYIYSQHPVLGALMDFSEKEVAFINQIVH